MVDDVPVPPVPKMDAYVKNDPRMYSMKKEYASPYKDARVEGSNYDSKKDYSAFEVAIGNSKAPKKLMNKIVPFTIFVLVIVAAIVVFDQTHGKKIQTKIKGILSKLKMPKMPKRPTFSQTFFFFFYTFSINNTF